MGRLKYLRAELVLLITLINSILNSSGFLMDLFSEKDRHGLSIRLDISDDECSNLPVAWANSAGSINTLGSCAQLYDEPFCKGSLVVIQPFHTIHQMDLSLINFQNRIQSASPCGPKIKTGRFVVQNAADATVLTVNSKYGGFARAHTTNATKVIPKFQQWEILDRGNSEYTLKPREFGDNYPVSFDEEALKKGQIKRKVWKLMSVGRGRYLIKNEPTQRCLYKTETNKIEEHDCRIWSPNQEWVFREIFGNPKPEKVNAAVGPGVNFNILSKVAGYRPPAKAPPQFYPIFYNVTTLAQIKKFSTAAPYIIRKKIKRGPRPKTRPFELTHHLRPPGLRPALSSKVANNNNYLLLRHPNNPNYNSSAKQPQEFVPSDDRLETFTYYEFVQKQALAAQKREEFLKQQRQKQQQELLLKKQKQKKKKEKEQDDDNSDDESKEDDEESQDDGYDSDEEEYLNRPPPKLVDTHVKQNLTDDSAGFLRKVYSKVKTGFGSMTSLTSMSMINLPIPIPVPSFLAKSDLKNETDAGESRYSHRKPPPDYPRYKVDKNLYRRPTGSPPPTPAQWSSNLEKSKSTSSATTTEKSSKSSMWDLFG